MLNQNWRETHYRLHSAGLLEKQEEKLLQAKRIRNFQLRKAKYIYLYRSAEFIHDHLIPQLLKNSNDFKLTNPEYFTDLTDSRLPIECYLHTVGREIILQTAGDCDISSLSSIQDDEKYLFEVWKQLGFQALGKQNYETYREGIITQCRELQSYDLKHLGIRCFTDKKNNPKMWEEYASHAQGVCLYIPTEPLVKEYTDGVRVASPLDFIFPVYYSDSERDCLKSEICNKPPVGLTGDILTKYNQLCALTKRTQYSDESEWRFVMGFYPNIPYDADIDETSRLRYLNHEMTFPIEAIELGSNISPIDKEAIYQAVSCYNNHEHVKSIQIFENTN